MKARTIRRYLQHMFLVGVVIFCLGLVLSFTSPVHAQTPTPPPPMADSLFLWQVNPLTITGNSDPTAGFVQGVTNVAQFSTPAGFLNKLFPYLFVFGGLIFFFMLVWAGAHMVVGSIDDPKALEIGKNRVGAAILGFVLLFMTYWLAQVVEAVFGVNVLG